MYFGLTLESISQFIWTRFSSIERNFETFAYALFLRALMSSREQFFTWAVFAVDQAPLQVLWSQAWALWANWALEVLLALWALWLTECSLGIHSQGSSAVVSFCCLSVMSFCSLPIVSFCRLCLCCGELLLSACGEFLCCTLLSFLSHLSSLSYLRDLSFWSSAQKLFELPELNEARSAFCPLWALWAPWANLSSSALCSHAVHTLLSSSHLSLQTYQGLFSQKWPFPFLTCIVLKSSLSSLS